MKRIKQFTSRMLAVMLAGTLAVGSLSVSAFGAEDAGSTAAAAEEFSLEEATENSAAEATATEEADREVMTESSSAEVVDGEGVSESPDAAFADTSQIAAEEEAVTSYTVTLDANGGYFANEWDDAVGDYVERAEVVTKKIPVGGTVTNIVPIMEQENAVATFLGWSLEPDGELVSQVEEEYIPEDNCVLYAVWQVEETEEIEGPETALPETNAEESIQDETNEDVQDENSEVIQEDTQGETNEGVQEDNPVEFTAEGETAQEDYSQETVVEEETAQEEDSLEQVVEEEITQEEDSLNAEVSQESEESSGTDEGSEATDGASQDDQTVITEEDDQQEIVSSNPVYTNLGDGTPEDFEANSVPISIGVNNVDVSVEEGSLYKFVPNEDDIYTFYSEGEYDTIGSLFGEIDGDMYALAVDDNSGADNNFSTSYELEEGKTYYLAVIFADYESGSGTRAITLRVFSDYCYGHCHEDGSGIVTGATCTEAGYTTYVCAECGKDYTDDFTDPLGHQFDDDGICTVCGMESPNRIKNAESHIEEDGDIYVAVDYYVESAKDCVAYVEIQEEGSEADPIIEYNALDSGGENKVYVYFNDIDKLPSYYTIKAYLVNAENDRIISNVYENNLHIRAFTELLDSDPEDYDENRTIEFSDDDFGVFSENTVIIYGNADSNTIRDFSGNIYTIENADSDTEPLQKGRELAYFYDNELQIIAHVTSVSRPQDDTVLVETEDPALEDVFEYLRIEEDVDDKECILDLSDLPEGVTYTGEGETFSYEDDETEIQSEAYYSVSEAATGSAMDNAGDNAVSDEETVSTPASMSDYSGLNETRTTLGCKQNFSLGPTKIGKTELNGNISVGISAPIRIYIAQSQYSMQCSSNVSFTGNISLSGKAEVQVPLGSFFIPIAYGTFSVNLDPVLFASFGGGASVSTSFTSSVTGRAETGKGYKIISRSANLSPIDLSVEGTFFTGIDLVPSLNLLKKCRVIELHCKVGPKMSASLSVPKPEDQLQSGDHICRKCIDGSGNIVFQVGYKLGLLGEGASGSTSFNLKGFEFYYSFDYMEGGRGKCPHIKDKEGGDDDDDDDDDDEVEKAEVVYDLGTNQFISQGRGWLQIPSLDVRDTIRVVNTKGWKDLDWCWSEDTSSIDHYAHEYDEEGNLITDTEIPIRRRDYTYISLLEYYGYSTNRLKVLPGVRSVEVSRFWPNCLEYIELSEGVEYIDFEDYYRHGYNSLKSINIPSSVTYLGWNCFSGCIRLTSITIQSGVTGIGVGAFRDCVSLTSITIPSSVEVIDDNAFSGCSSLKSVTIPSSVTEIGHGAFGECSSLKSVSIPSGVTEIGDGAFEDCGSLTSITIPSSVTKIGNMAFSGCSSLTSVAIPSSLTDIPYGVFSACSSLTSVTIPSSVMKIGEGAFTGCNSLKSVTIPSSVTEIGHGAFGECSSLKSVTIPSGVTKIDCRAFEECSSLTSVTIPSSVRRICEEAFKGCSSLTSVAIPSSVTEIGYSAFEECSSLTSVTIPSSVTEIGSAVFSGCSSLTTVAIPSSVTNIGWEAFYGCSNLSNVTIPRSVEYIDEYAFEDCPKLTISGYRGTYAETYANDNNIPFKPIKKSIKNAKVSGLVAKTYTGKPLTQSPIIVLDKIKLKNNTDFKVSYKNNTNVGTATMTITGIGNYEGAITKTFKINKAAQSITVKAAASSVAVGKTTTVSLTGNKGSKSFKSSDTSIATVTSAGKVTAKKVGTVKITATAAANANYKAASKTVTIKVVPAATASLTAANQATGIKLTWKKVTGANGYKVYRGSTLIKTITSGSIVTYADTAANTNGTKYTYKVVAKASTGDSTLSKSVTTYRVARPVISSAINSAASKMTVKWGKNAKATGYQIQYSTSSSFASGNKTATITSASTVSKVIGSLTKGKTYYVRIRTYKTVGSTKYWSTWSASKSVKITK